MEEICRISQTGRGRFFLSGAAMYAIMDLALGIEEGALLDRERSNRKMKLTTKRCAVRPFTMDDAPDLYKILSDKEVMRHIEPPFDLEQTREFIRTAGLCEPPLVYALIWRETGEVIGHVIFHPYDQSGWEIGWVLGRAYWGMVIAQETTEAMVNYSRTTGIKSCVIECGKAQTVSRHIALKNHFAPEGEENGRYIYRLGL